MPLNPSVGHLYHDHNISNECTALDAKEIMRTRESNAREAKHLAKYSYGIDRARTACLKHNAWEQRAIQISLNNIKARTPSLSKGLLLETERKRLRDFQRSKVESCWSSHTIGRSGRTHQLQSVVSPWSVYSQLPDSAGHTDGYVSKGRTEQTSSCFSHNNCGQGSGKADFITKALHKLYTKGIERKWRESNTTVLEVLGKGSKEELETALFILRGTATGDVIEDILREKELVSKRADNGVLKLRSSNGGGGGGGKSGRGSLDDALIAPMNVDESDLIDKASSEGSGSRQHSETSVSTTCNASSESCGSKHNSETSASTTCKASSESSGRMQHSETRVSKAYNASSESSGSRQQSETSVSTAYKASCESSGSRHFSKASDSTVDTDKVLLNIEDTISDKPCDSLSDNDVFIKPVRRSKKGKYAKNTAVDIRGAVFERDASWTMSSIAANPSEHELNPQTMKWTQLLRAPELWKTNTYTSVKNAKLNRPKHVSLVTLSGKRRRTLLNR